MKRTLLPVIILLLFSSCCSSKIDNTATLLNYNIRLSQSGGFTGASTGYSIDSTGIVTSLRGMPNSSLSKSPKGKFSAEQIKTLNDLFPSIIHLSYSENGNMTTSLLLTKGNNNLSFSFSGMEPGKEVPAELTKFYKTLNAIINNIKD